MTLCLTLTRSRVGRAERALPNHETKHEWRVWQIALARSMSVTEAYSCAIGGRKSSAIENDRTASSLFQQVTDLLEGKDLGQKFPGLLQPVLLEEPKRVLEQVVMRLAGE